MQKTKRFIKEMYEDITEGNLDSYRDMYDEVINEESTTQYLKDINLIYSKLSNEEKDAFFRILKEINIDTISSVLRIIDGFGNINYEGIEPKVLLGDQDTEGDMQELFLEYIEELEEAENSIQVKTENKIQDSGADNEK